MPLHKDASKKAMLIQKGIPVWYTLHECNYPKIKWKALGTIYSVEHFHHYMYGKPFTLETNQKPLESTKNILLTSHNGFNILFSAMQLLWYTIPHSSLESFYHHWNYAEHEAMINFSKPSVLSPGMFWRIDERGSWEEMGRWSHCVQLYCWNIFTRTKRWSTWLEPTSKETF